VTIPLVYQLASTVNAEFKDTQRRFISQTLLATTNPRTATPSEIGRRAFDLWVSSLPVEQQSLAATQANLEQFVGTAGEMLATKQNKPMISPAFQGLIVGWLAGHFGPKVVRWLDGE
jgi:hypothetical protein